jgi:hypothetical protein
VAEARHGSLYWKTAIISEGLRVGFRTNREALISKFDQLRVLGVTPADFRNLDFVYSLEESGRESYSACLGSQTLIVRASLKAALDSIDSDLQHTIATYSREHLFVHAGVVGWRGRAVLFPGRTYSGKSTLVRALIQAGAIYFSDEFARVDARGMVHPFIRPLSFRSPEGKSTLHPEKERLKIASHPWPIGAIIATRFVPEGAWRPERLSPGRAALEVLSNAVAIRLDPTKAVRYVGKLAAPAYAITSPRGEAEATVPFLLQTLDGILG